MYQLTWLVDVLRSAGLKVVEQPGWKDRGVGNMGTVRGIICHHTAGSKTGNAPSLNVVQNGRSDLRGPLSQLVLGRDGTFFVVAAGACNHAGKGNWQGVTNGNTQMIGIEAENAGVSSDPWPLIQMDAYARGCAAILRHLKLPAIMCCGHKEYALPKGRKPDPTFDMNLFRNRVASLMGDAQAPVPVPQPQKPAQPKRNVTAAMRRRMCEWIAFNEQSVQPNDPLRVIAPAVGDGGAFEVAGITEKHHPDIAHQLKKFVDSGDQKAARDLLYAYYLKYTAPVAVWLDMAGVPNAGVEAALRDAGIHRGCPKGAAMILQYALRVDVDGIVGRDTLEALGRINPEELIERIGAAREKYEREEIGFRPQFWKGFQARWKRMTKWALELQKEQNAIMPAVQRDVTGSGGVGGAVGIFTGWLTSSITIGIVVGLVVFGFILWSQLRNRKKIV